MKFAKADFDIKECCEMKIDEYFGNTNPFPLDCAVVQYRNS